MKMSKVKMPKMPKLKGMKKANKYLLCAIMASVVINLLLPQVVKPLATPSEVKPPNGAAALPFKSQVMHMLVHHAQVPLTSSVVVAVIVALSITLGNMCGKKL